MQPFCSFIILEKEIGSFSSKSSESLFSLIMPFYELVLIAKAIPSSQSSVSSNLAMKNIHKKLLKLCATHVLDRNGVVRQFNHLGERPLPYRMKRHQQIFDYARYKYSSSYFAIQFDANPATMKSLCDELKHNEAVIRHTVINMGNSLKAVTQHQEPALIR